MAPPLWESYPQCEVNNAYRICYLRGVTLLFKLEFRFRHPTCGQWSLKTVAPRRSTQPYEGGGSCSQKALHACSLFLFLGCLSTVLNSKEIRPNATFSSCQVEDTQGRVSWSHLFTTSIHVKMWTASCCLKGRVGHVEVTNESPTFGFSYFE